MRRRKNGEQNGQRQNRDAGPPERRGRGRGRVLDAGGGGKRACPGGSAHGRFGRHGVDDHRHRPRADDDDPGPRSFLWRHGPQEERRRDDGAEFRPRGADVRRLDGDRLFARLRRRRRHAGLCRRSRQSLPVRPRRRQHFGHDSRKRLHDLPDDLRHHHGGPHHRRLRRPHEVLEHARLHDPLVDRRLCAGLPLGLGRRLSRFGRRSRLRGRHGGAHQCRHRGPCRLSRARSAQGLRHREHGSRTTSCSP